MPTQNHSKADTTETLCVSMEGALVPGSLLTEMVFGLIRRRPAVLLLLPLWLLKGRLYLQKRVFAEHPCEPALLPYRAELITWLESQRGSGRHIVLCSSAPSAAARSVADHLQLFDDVVASDADTFLAGKQRATRLVSLYGRGQFDYVGTADRDLPVWEQAAQALLVAPTNAVRSGLRPEQANSVICERPGGALRSYLKAVRPHQWLKNVLLFVPLAASHQLMQVEAVLATVVAFIAFVLCTSSVYLLNDLLDLPSDRRHATKRNRPIASGRLPAAHAAALMPILLVAGFATALLLPPAFAATLATYYALTLAYSFKLKEAALIDVIVLAGLYTIRVIAGAAAIGVPPSFWLLVFSMFLFLSLALIKRYTEVIGMPKGSGPASSGRGYYRSDADVLAQFGTSSAYLAVLVLALYINSAEIQVLYHRPELVWLACPLVLYMLSRLWLKAVRGEMHEDPVVFVLSDRRSQFLVAAGGALFWAAT